MIARLMQRAAYLTLAACTATAATFPEKPIRVVVPSGAGGPAELCLRAVMDVMRDEKLPERAARIGPILEERMQSWAAEHQLIGDVRGMGAMAGMELVRDRKTREPADQEPATGMAVGRDAGRILVRAGTQYNGDS